jgi:hypothetical protein
MGAEFPSATFPCSANRTTPSVLIQKLRLPVLGFSGFAQHSHENELVAT